jgi:hypothetical protein
MVSTTRNVVERHGNAYVVDDASAAGTTSGDATVAAVSARAADAAPSTSIAAAAIRESAGTILKKRLLDIR